MNLDGATAMDDPERCVDGLMEQLVLGFQLEASRFLLVAEVPKPEGADRAFGLFIFEGVTGFQRELGERVELQRYFERYQSTGAHPVVVQHVQRTEEPAGTRRFELWLGPSMGGLSFELERLEGWTRAARAQAGDGGWIYIDLVSGAPLSFRDPFSLAT